jgi:plastocyanin
MKKLPLVCVGVVVATLIVACGGGGNDSGSASPTAAAPTSAATATGSPAAALFATTLDFRFNPAELEVKAGVETTLKVNNAGSTTHTFTVDNLTDSGFIEPGNFLFLTFTVDQPGDYQFYCQVHGAATMSGTLHVVP